MNDVVQHGIDEARRAKTKLLAGKGLSKSELIEVMDSLGKAIREVVEENSRLRAELRRHEYFNQCEAEGSNIQ